MPQREPAAAAPPAAAEAEPRLCRAADYDLPPTGRVADRIVVHTSGGPVEVPGLTADYDTIRAWALSDESPDDFKFSFLDGYAEIGRMIEAVASHATPKVEIVHGLRTWAKRGRRGLVFTDSTLLSEPSVGLSCEPDVILLLPETEAAGRVSWTPQANRPGDAVELVGAPDLVGEVVSDGSTRKDLTVEPPLLYAAGVREFWRADCRGDRCDFTIFARGPTGWLAVEPDAEGFARSAVTGQAHRLVRLPPAANGWIDFDLQARD